MKRLRIVLSGLGLVIVLAVALMATARADVTATPQGTRYRYLDDVLEERSTVLRAQRWEAPLRPLVLPVSASEALEVRKHIGAAGAAFGVAHGTGEINLLAGWFGDAALARVEKAAATAFAKASRMAVLRHTFRPEFHHLNGSLIQVRSDTLAARFAQDYFELATDTLRTTLSRVSTGWYVIAHERIKTRPAEPTPAPVTLPDMLAGVNYYPARTPWSAFWPNYDPNIITTDMRLVRELGGNTMRIFLPVADFEPGPALQRNLNNLSDFLARAGGMGLWVIPTLFDLKGSYAVSTWTEDIMMLENVLPVIAAAPAVVLVDIKNEPDLDFVSYEKSTVLAWLRTMVAETRNIAPGLPLTVGWATADSGPLLMQQLDVISYHDYAPLNGTKTRLAEVRAAADDKPVLVTEIGFSAWSLINGFPSSNAAQAKGLGARMDGLAEADGVLIWTLHDFPDPDSRAVGSSFWVRGLQARFGLYNDTGEARPSVAVVRKAFAHMLNKEKP